MQSTMNTRKKVFLSYSYSENKYIDWLCKRINKEGFQAIADGTELMPGERILSVAESNKMRLFCTYNFG